MRPQLLHQQVVGRADQEQVDDQQAGDPGELDAGHAGELVQRRAQLARQDPRNPRWVTCRRPRARIRGVAAAVRVVLQQPGHQRRPALPPIKGRLVQVQGHEHDLPEPVRVADDGRDAARRRRRSRWPRSSRAPSGRWSNAALNRRAARRPPLPDVPWPRRSSPGPWSAAARRLAVAARRKPSQPLARGKHLAAARARAQDQSARPAAATDPGRQIAGRPAVPAGCPGWSSRSACERFRSRASRSGKAAGSSIWQVRRCWVGPRSRFLTASSMPIEGPRPRPATRPWTTDGGRQFTGPQRAARQEPGRRVRGPPAGPSIRPGSRPNLTYRTTRDVPRAAT